MKEKNTVRLRATDLEPGDTDWARVDALTDDQIEEAMASDPDAAPILDDAWFRQAQWVVPAKVATSIRLDGDVIDWFRSQGAGWQTRMNAILRAYAKAHRGVS